MNDLPLTRRAMLTGLGCACCAGLPGVAHAFDRVRPAAMQPLIGPGHQPTDADERGMWQQYERVEQEIAGSNLLLEDPKLASYLSGIAGRVGGPAARDLRVYLAQIPEFNAFMAPTGFMVVFSGLLTRVRDEAQLSGVIAHEAGHFLRRHHIRHWRDLRRRTDLLTVLGMGLGLGGAATGVGLGNAYQLAQIGTILNMAAYGRGLEAEADAMGVRLMAESGLDPTAMPEIWQQLIGEMEESARQRRRRPRRGTSLLATHPAPKDRMEDLRLSAAEVATAGRSYERGRERFQAAIAPHRKDLLEEMVKLNDPGTSLYNIRSLAAGGWDGMLRFFEGEAWRLKDEKGDRERAAASYALAVTFPDAPPEAWRAHGHALIRAGRREEGRAALARYLQLAPNAPDAAIVRASIGG
jgi:beta-barrel assembly-enhancing protease